MGLAIVMGFGPLTLWAEYLLGYFAVAVAVGHIVQQIMHVDRPSKNTS